MTARDGGSDTIKVSFRFQTLEVWRDAHALADPLLDIALRLETEKRYSLANQLTRACISVSNNIAEGSGAFSAREFAHFLAIARRSLFECANILLLLRSRNLIDDINSEDLIRQIDHLSRRLTSFRRRLLAPRSPRNASEVQTAKARDANLAAASPISRTSKH